MKRLPELTLKQKNRFLKIAIKLFTRPEGGYYICWMFRNWYNIHIRDSDERAPHSSYCLVTFPELLTVIQRRLQYYERKSTINHRGQDLNFAALPARGDVFDSYRLKLIKKVQAKINKDKK